MEGQKSLPFHQKDLDLCFEDEQKTGMTQFLFLGEKVFNLKYITIVLYNMLFKVIIIIQRFKTEFFPEGNITAGTTEIGKP